MSVSLYPDLWTSFLFLIVLYVFWICLNYSYQQHNSADSSIYSQYTGMFWWFKNIKSSWTRSNCGQSMWVEHERAPGSKVSVHRSNLFLWPLLSAPSLLSGITLCAPLMLHLILGPPLTAPVVDFRPTPLRFSFHSCTVLLWRSNYN